MYYDSHVCKPQQEALLKVLCDRKIILTTKTGHYFRGILQTYIPRRGKEIAFGSDSSNNSNFLVWSIVKYLKIYP